MNVKSEEIIRGCAYFDTPSFGLQKKDSDDY